MPDFRIGDFVEARQYPGAHRFPGTVVGRTFGRPPHRYDVRDLDGEIFPNVAEVWADEPSFTQHRERVDAAKKELIR